MSHYDVIVLGTGGVGSAALYHLARRGARVLGIDRFEPGHYRGSSHGQTRLIRQAYYEHPDYVPLLRRAFELWAQLEAEADEKLYYETGLIQIGPPGGEVVAGVRESARQHRLEIENFTAAECRARFPAFAVPDGCEGVFERRAGYLLVETAVKAHVTLACRAGATFANQTVNAWRIEDSRVIVETDRERHSADRLIIAAGPWAGQMLADLRIPLTVLRKPLYWWRTIGDAYRAEFGAPAFLYELPNGCFYGVPQIDELGVKVAEHTGGQPVVDPLNVNRGLDEADRDRVAKFVVNHLWRATSECTHHVTCMYTMSPDSHFIVDRHPEHPQVCFAAGLSGHGFKFTCVLGEALADLALSGRTELPIGFLSLNRPSLRPIS